MKTWIDNACKRVVRIAEHNQRTTPDLIDAHLAQLREHKAHYEHGLITEKELDALALDLGYTATYHRTNRKLLLVRRGSGSQYLI